MLEDLLRDGTGVFIFLDSSECSGQSLLKSSAQLIAQRGEPVHVLSFDISEEDFRAGLESDISSRVKYHDGYHDPLGWNNEAELTAESFTLQQILARVLGSPGTDGGAASVIIDSLSWILLHSPVTAVLQTLHHLTRAVTGKEPKIRQVLALVHQDLHEPAAVASICHLASTVVTLMPIPSNISPACGGEALAMAAVRHRKKTGKIIKQDLCFAVLEGFTLKTVQHLAPQSEKALEAAAEVDPAANLTFNLHLSDAARQAKERLSLPYVFSTEKKSSLLQSRGGGGMIYYEPDSVDDIDDEDPDDDLDV
ncbi:elongator complex protein 5 [Ambystoma mexicanum]|uniref:elongator complex protein 5 n=1 Tax=Ambystoma mexicanum TaxID=8296 RepID=UPI0037E8C48F